MYKNDCGHPGDCGCTPFLVVDMIENAGAALSRRTFVKGIAAVGGMLATGAATSCALAAKKPAGEGTAADTIYHGGPIPDPPTRIGCLYYVVEVFDNSPYPGLMGVRTTPAL